MQTTDKTSSFDTSNPVAYPVDPGIDWDAYWRELNAFRPPLVAEKVEPTKPAFFAMLRSACAYSFKKLREDVIMPSFLSVALVIVVISIGQHAYKLLFGIPLIWCAFFLKRAVGKLHSEICCWENKRLYPTFAVKVALIHAVWWVPLSLFYAANDLCQFKPIRHSETFIFNPLVIVTAFGCSALIFAYLYGIEEKKKGEEQNLGINLICVFVAYYVALAPIGLVCIWVKEPNLSIYDALVRYSRFYTDKFTIENIQTVLITSGQVALGFAASMVIMGILLGVCLLVVTVFSPQRYSKENQQFRESLAKQVWIPVHYALAFVLLYCIFEFVIPMMVPGYGGGQELWGMLPPAVLWLALTYLVIQGVPLLAQGVQIAALDVFVRDKLTDEEYARIERAFENTREFQFKEALGFWGWKRAAEHHRECDQASTSTLELWLHHARVFTPHTPYHLKGKTTEDGITLAIWQSRHDKDEALLKAAEADLVQGKAQAETAPDLEKRREAEGKKEGAAAEVQRYKGQREVRPEALPAFGGQCAIHTINGIIKHVVLEVAAGDYSVRLYDELKNNSETKRADVQQDGELVPVDFSSEEFKFDNTELIVRRRGSEIEARLPLW